MLISALTFFAAIAVTRQHEVEVPVTKVSASYMYDLFMGQGRFGDPPFSRSPRGLVPVGVTLEITPGKNSLTVRGSLDGTREMAQIISVIDIAPRSIELDIHAYARPLDRAINAKISTANNGTWEYVDPSSDTTIRITPRLNGDGTIVISYDLGTLGFGLHGLVRIRPGGYVYARVYTEEIIDEETGEKRLALVIRHSGVKNEIPSFFEVDDPFKNSGFYKYIHGGPVRQSSFGVSSRIGQPIDHIADDLSVKNPPAGLDIRLELVAMHEKVD